MRESTSIFDVTKKEKYVCEILDGGVKPLFKVTPMSDPSKPLQSHSSSGVWIDICKRVNEKQGNVRKIVTVSGPERYGLAEPGVG